MQKRIELKFDTSVMRLAGYQYGKNIFDEQVAPIIDYSQKTVIVFPQQIIRIASSFVQGFFEKIIENVGVSGIGKVILIEPSDSKLYDSIIDNLI